MSTTTHYSKEHEWCSTQNSTASIGITDHAQSALGDIVYLELPKVGRVLKVGETFGVVESIKAVSDLYSPVEGKVIEVNSALAENPAEINKNAMSSWMIRVETQKPVTGLMDEAAYSSYVKSLK